MNFKLVSFFYIYYTVCFIVCVHVCRRFLPLVFNALCRFDVTSDSSRPRSTRCTATRRWLQSI